MFKCHYEDGDAKRGMVRVRVTGHGSELNEAGLQGRDHRSENEEDERVHVRMDHYMLKEKCDLNI